MIALLNAFNIILLETISLLISCEAVKMNEEIIDKDLSRDI